MIRKSMFNKHIDAGNERRGVAPIIATLLMVAIAVVGGILIFVFAQGFFSGTSDLNVGGNEALALTGYDARDTASLRMVNGTAFGDDLNAAGGGLLTDDAIVIYARNTGTKPVTISSIDCNDSTTATLATADETLAPGEPAAGEFAVATKDTTGSDADIEGGETGHIIVRYTGSDLSNGRNMTCKVFTVAGNEFSIPISIGKRDT